jgi:hypothetical protein
MDIPSMIVGGLISIVLSLIIMPLFQDIVIYALVNIFGGWLFLRRSQNISGFWSQIWDVDNYTGKQP